MANETLQTLIDSITIESGDFETIKIQNEDLDDLADQPIDYAGGALFATATIHFRDGNEMIYEADEDGWCLYRTVVSRYLSDALTGYVKGYNENN